MSGKPFERAEIDELIFGYEVAFRQSVRASKRAFDDRKHATGERELQRATSGAAILAELRYQKGKIR